MSRFSEPQCRECGGGAGYNHTAGCERDTAAPHSETCRFNPPCETQEEMRQRHGTPDQFFASLLNAADMITADEITLADRSYRHDWARAGKVKP